MSAVAGTTPAGAMRAPVKLFDAVDGYGLITNLMAAGDPDVHRIGDRWWMFLGAAHVAEKVNLFSASLPPGAPLTSTDWTITADGAHARPLLEHPPEGRWDEWLHTPAYVRVGDRERLYFTGSVARSARSTGMDRDLAIGALERDGDRWASLPEPLITGTPDRPEVLEPKVIHAGGRYRMWYMATPKEVDEGVSPDNHIVYVDSQDGVTGWSAPQVLFDERLNYHDAVVADLGDRYAMVVATAPNLHGADDYPPQGLWLLTSGRPSGDRADWTAEPLRILDGADGAPWYAGAIYAPAIVPDGDTLHVFFTATYEPDPEPYLMTIGRLDIPVADLPAPGRT